MKNKIGITIIIALFVLLLGETLIIGIKAMQNNDERIAVKEGEIKRLALESVGENGKDASISFVGAEICPESGETWEAYILTVEGQKCRVWAKIGRDGAIAEIEISKGDDEQ